MSNGRVVLFAGGRLGPRISDDWDCNVYMVRGDRRSILVDAGCGRVPLTAPDGVDAVLLTHLHLDHSGGAAALASQGLRVLAHPWSAAGLRQGDEDRAGLTAARNHGFYPADSRLRALPAAEDMVDGTEIDLGGVTVVAVETPGHADGHLAFLVSSDDGPTTLLAGDLCFPGGSVVLQPLPDCRLDRLWDSLCRVRALAPDDLAAGHGMPAPGAACGSLDTAIAAFAGGAIPQQFEA
jgi:hydroxyacylglutathione hydrolase